MSLSSSDSETKTAVKVPKTRKKKVVKKKVEDSDSDYDDDQWLKEDEEEQKLDQKFERVNKPSKRKDFHRYGFLPSTRKELMKKQNFTIDSKDPQKATMDDTMGGTFDLVKKKGKWVEDRKFKKKEHRPVIDHKQDVEAEIQAYDSDEIYTSGEEYDDDYKDTFKQFNYSDQSNLRILSKKIDKDSKLNPTFRRDTVPKGLVKKEKARLKGNYVDYKNALKDSTSEVSQLLEKRRRKRKKKKMKKTFSDTGGGSDSD